jgi:hypothetical protein
LKWIEGENAEKNAMNWIFKFAFGVLGAVPSALMLSVVVLSATQAGYERLLLAGDWAQFAPADRSRCLQSTGISGRYTDLIKCLEIRQEAHRLPQKPAMPSG